MIQHSTSTQQIVDSKRSAAVKGWEIAVIGASCRLPEAENLETLWKQLRGGRSTSIPATMHRRLLRHFAQSSLSQANGSTDRQALEMLWFLDAVQDALQDAGLGAAIGDFGRVEAIMGRGRRRAEVRPDLRTAFEVLAAIHPELREDLLDTARNDIAASLATADPTEASRVSEARYIDTLRITEPTFIVEAGPASGLLAVEFACRSLLDHRAQLAIAGAVDLGDAVEGGQGVGVVVLKRLADAEQNGDRIDSIIQGIGACSRQFRVHDSNSNVLKDYRQTIRRAYRLSGVDPSTVDLIVSGTGELERQASEALFTRAATQSRAWNDSIGDQEDDPGVGGIIDLIQASLAIRQRALPPSRGFFDFDRGFRDPAEADSGSQRPRPWIRSRLDQPRRAGVNAFSKGGMSLHAVIEEPQRAYGKANLGLMNDWDSEAIFLDADDRASWLVLARALLQWFEQPGHLDVAIKDLAHTLNFAKEQLPFRVGMVVTSARDLRDRLGFLVAKLSDPSCRSIQDSRGTYFREEPVAKNARIAFLFPGEGSQYPGMLADLAPYFPEILHGFETSDRIARERGHTQRPSEAIFQADTNVETGLFSTVAAVNIVLSAQLGLYRLVSRLGIKPDAVAGHSSGEFLAMVAAGVFPADAELEDRLGRLGSIFETLDAQGAVPKAKLIAASAPRERLEVLLRDLGLSDAIAVAIDNCPHQVILAGQEKEVDALIEALRASKILFEVLPFDRAYHTPRFQEAIDPIRSFFRELPMRRPAIPIYSCMTASTMPTDVGSIRKLAVDQWRAPVAFRSTVEAMYQNGIRIFVEVGVRGSLTGFVDDTLRNRPHVAIASNVARRSGMTQLNHLAASLHAEGVDLRMDDFYRMRSPRLIDFSKDLKPAEPGTPIVFENAKARLSDGVIQRIRSTLFPVVSASSPESLSAKSAIASETSHEAPIVDRFAKSDFDWREVAARRLEEQTEEALRIVDQIGHSQVGAIHPQEAEFLSYLRTMDEFLETQRAVLEAYFDGPATSDEEATQTEEPRPRRRKGPDLIHDLPQDSLKLWEREPAQPIPAEPIADTSRKAFETHAANDIEQILLDEVSRRTGYPREILGLDLDMESDLGIDSIKRVEILGELRSRAGLADDLSFERLARCQTLGAIVAELAPISKGRGKSAEVPPYWPGVIVEWVRGDRFVGTRLLDGATDPIATEHTLGGRRISAVDPGLLGLPVVPFTVMVEYLAQAANLLEPGKVVVGFRDVQAHRWIAYESEPSTLEFQAERRDDGAIIARIWDRGVASRNGSSRGPRNDRPSVEGVVLLADRRAECPEPWPYDPGDAGPCRFEAQELYDDQWLFHGPPLQALKRVGLSSPTAIEGSLVVLPRRVLLPESQWPTLHTDPIVFDAFTHLLGCWGLDKKAGEEGDLMFPLRMGKLDLFGDAPPEGAEILCRIQIQEVSRHQVRVNAELVGPNNATWARIEAWEDWRFYWADRFRDVCRNPQGILIGRTVDIEQRPENLSVVVVEPPSDMLKPIWGDVIEWIHLSPEERRRAALEWPSPRERNRRLLGKIAAKEAARRLWLSSGLDAVFPADLEIERAPLGESRIRSRVADDPKPMPKVAFASIDGIGLGAASLDSRAKLGVALETIGDRDHLVTTLETDWIDHEIPDEAERLEWIARVQAAKTAVAQAEPNRNRPIHELMRVDWSIGRIAIASASDANTGKREVVEVLTGRLGEHVWALTLGERIELP